MSRLRNIWLACSLLTAGGCQGLTEQQKVLLVDGERAYQQQRYAAAIQHLSHFLSQAEDRPEGARARYVRGMAFAMEDQRVQAYADLEIAARQESDADVAWRANAALGVLSFEDENWTRASQAFERAVAQMPRVAPKDALLYRLGLCYERQGRWPDALATHRQIAGVFPTGRYAADARRRLQLQADHFAVQAGVYDRPESADRLVTELRAADLPAYVRREVRNDHYYNVVLVGRFDSFEEANQMLARVRGYVPKAQLWP